MPDLNYQNMFVRLEGAYRRSLLAKHNLLKPAVRAFIGVGECILAFDSAPIRSLPERLAMLFGRADRQLVETISLFIHQGCVFWDVGANIGYITWLLAKLCKKDTKCYAFEPNPEIFAVLIRNLESKRLGALCPSPLELQTGRCFYSLGSFACTPANRVSGSQPVTTLMKFGHIPCRFEAVTR
jgi:hypothetical protein